MEPSHTVHYGYICDGDEVIDEVLVLVMRGPRSYTAEDTVEIDCHGGILVTKRILETVFKIRGQACGAWRIYQKGIFKRQDGSFPGRGCH